MLCTVFDNQIIAMTDLITIYSQNVSCDSHSRRLKEVLGEEYSFDNRIAHLIDGIPTDRKIDVVALNEIRYKDNVDNVTQLLQKKKFIVGVYPNNHDAMTFNNILAIAENSIWEKVDCHHKWTAVDEETKKPCLKDEHSTIEGDAYGRCAGIAHLKNKASGRQVCVLVSHVVPFGKAKVVQQDALFSLNKENVSKKAPIPTIIVGDLNRFWDENDEFQKHLKSYSLVESVPTQLVIEKGGQKMVFKDSKDIGTFTPWPIDNLMYDKLLDAPLSLSRLDVHLCVDDKSLMEIVDTYTRPSMMKDPNMDPLPKSRNKVRFLLDQRMASDHIAVIGRYRILK